MIVRPVKKGRRSSIVIFMRFEVGKKFFGSLVDYCFPFPNLVPLDNSDGHEPNFV
jgi:hypothetical protein